VLGLVFKTSVRHFVSRWVRLPLASANYSHYYQSHNLQKTVSVSPIRRQNQVEWVTAATRLHQRDHINATQGLLKSGARTIDPSRRYLVKDLESVSWLKDDNGNTPYRLDSRNPERLHQSGSVDYGLRVICGARYGEQKGSAPR
jgi:hypothetical protein